MYKSYPKSLTQKVPYCPTRKQSASLKKLVKDKHSSLFFVAKLTNFLTLTSGARDIRVFFYHCSVQ
jgi:hypothetical protein